MDLRGIAEINDSTRIIVGGILENQKVSNKYFFTKTDGLGLQRRFFVALKPTTKIDTDNCPKRCDNCTDQSDCS